MAYLNGRASWEISFYDDIADAIKEAAIQEGVSIKWGAAWSVEDIRQWEGTMEEAITTTPESYEQRVNEIRVGEAKQFFDKYYIMECKINENTMTVRKTGAGQDLKFEIHKFGSTGDIMKEAKAFKIDLDSIAECTHLTKYFGPYDITKTNENKFIFTKGDQSALISKVGW